MPFGRKRDISADDACMPRVRLTAAGVAMLLLAAVSAAQTDPYTFADGRSRSIDVAITSADGVPRLTWPDVDGSDWDTALVRVDATASDLGTPYVEMASGGLADRQYLRPGASGPVWLNVSFLHPVLRHGSHVTIRGDGVSLQSADRPATLRLFAAHPDLSKRILVLAPHPDDAEIGTFGAYAGRNATVVTITAGNAGGENYEAVFGDDEQTAHYRFKGHVRVIDSVTVPWQGGIPPDRCFNLGYFDARLGDMFAEPDAVIPERYGPNTDIGVYRRDNVGSLLSKGSRESTWANLVDDLVAVLKKVKPDVVFAPHPQLDSHLDHQLTTVALAEALARWKKPVTLLLYTNHADGNAYPYGPAGTVMSLPQAARGALLDRVFSLPVPPDVQRRQLFAIESMHDVRFSPMRQYQLARGDGRTIQPEKPGPMPDITYLRRGPRSNQIFYAYDADTLKPMIAAYLAARRARAPQPAPAAR
jgi:LmbE family N-acetylglucosaminyl deacetylase